MKSSAQPSCPCRTFYGPRTGSDNPSATCASKCTCGIGWSDEEMYDAFLYNVQVRYALGYHNLGEVEFELRSVYNFSRRVAENMQKTGRT